MLSPTKSHPVPAGDPISTPRLGLPSGRLFWVLGFVYAALMALAFQKLILPLLPGLHAGNGLLHNDAKLFHDMAVEAAQQIRVNGWGAWSLFPSNGAGGNVGLLAALYVIFGPDPACFIPFNAAAHATGALMLYKIGARLIPERTGAIGGLIAGVVFLVFPSGLQWYGQNLKDAFSIAGILMLVYAQMGACQEGAGSIARSMAVTFVGAVLVAAVRPYFPILLLAGFAVAWGGIALEGMARNRARLGRRLGRGGALLLVIGAVTIVSAQAKIFGAAIEGELASGAVYTRLTNWEWRPSEWAPPQIDSAMARMAQLRAHFVGYNRSVSAGSGIDEERLPGDVVEVIAYLPRALEIGLFAPFPAAWGDRVSATRLVGAIETAIWYLFFPGTLLLLWRRLSQPAGLALTFAAALLTLLAFVYPNVGNLYRQRFAFWMLVLTCGAVGWADFLFPRFSRGEPRSEEASSSRPDFPAAPGGGMDAVVAAGALVMGITLVCYLGFIARDLLLVRIFGVSARLDGYFFAAMLPTFFVTCFGMPMADAFMRSFVDAYLGQGVERAARLARVALWHGTLAMGALTLVLEAFAGPVMRLGLSEGSPAELAEATAIFRCLVPILALSAWTVLGNAVLNGLRRYRVAALAQLVVPTLTIAAIVSVPPEFGLYPAIFGMLFGTLINVAIVVAHLARIGIGFWPEPAPLATLPPGVVTSYRQLALAGLIGAAATPLGYALAGTAGAGAISTWALASKMVTLFAGLAGVGVASVILPRLVRMMRERLSRVRSDVLIFLFGGSWIAGTVAVLICEFSPPIAAALVGDGVDDARLATLADVLRIGALQLPIVISYTVMMKTSAVIGTSARALAGSAIALVAYLGLAFLAVDRFGVAGLAAAALASVAIGAAYLAVMVRKACGFGLGEVTVLVVGWAIWIGVALAVITGGAATILCAMLGLGGLGWAQVRALGGREWEMHEEGHPT